MSDDPPVIIGGDLDEERSERVLTFAEQLDSAVDGADFAATINGFFTYLESIKDDG
jgi:hypothetical protein